MSHVVIVGAGITGLSCAWRLKQLGIEARVLESSSRPGGVIRSERVDGYLIEHGPNSLLPTSNNFALLDESGLTAEIVEGDPHAPRYVSIGRTLRKIPFGPMTLSGMMRAAAEPFIRSTSPADESIHDFFVRRFGPEIEARLVSPFVTGIYAGNTRELEMTAQPFSKLLELERKYGSVILGMMRSPKPKGARKGHTCTFKDGMETLPRRLAAACDIQYGVMEIDVSARPLVITAPAYHAARILEPILPEASRLLKQIDYAPMLIATTTIPDSAFSAPLHGFGFLVPRSEKLHLLGTLFSSALFPGRAPAGRQLLTSFIGGALEREAVEWPDDRVWDVVRSELQTVLKTSTPPESVHLTRRTHAIPQYKIGHERLITSLKKELSTAPGLFLAGSYMDGVSVASCLENGERLAREVAQFLRKGG